MESLLLELLIVALGALSVRILTRRQSQLYS